VLGEAVAAGRLRADLDPDRMAHVVGAAIQGGSVLAIAEQDIAPFEQARAGVMDLLRAASPAPPPAPTLHLGLQNPLRPERRKDH
jgi:TetR/AcrR family transcriptional repressor of nem operon